MYKTPEYYLHKMNDVQSSIYLKEQEEKLLVFTKPFDIVDNE